METLRFGVVGIGNMGSAHAVQLFEGRVKGAKLAAVCDCRRERLEWAGERLGRVPRYEDYETLLDSGEVDAGLLHQLHVLLQDVRPVQPLLGIVVAAVDEAAYLGE